MIRQTLPSRRLLSMNRVAALWAKHTGTPRPHRATVIRWATKGVKGIRLQAERLGGRWYSTDDAVIDFHRQLVTAAPGGCDLAPGATRAAQIQEALEQLDRRIGNT